MLSGMLSQVVANQQGSSRRSACGNVQNAKIRSIIGANGVYKEIQDWKRGNRGAGLLETGRKSGADGAYWVGKFGGGAPEVVGRGEGSDTREGPKVTF